MAVDTSTGPYRGSIYGVWTDHAQGTANPNPVRTVAEVEPNDSLYNATPVAIGDDIVGAITGNEHENDEDLFTFEGTAGTTIQISGTRGSLKLICGNDLSELTQVGCGSMYEASIPPAIYTLPTTGRYYLYVGLFAASSYRYQLREYVVDPSSVARDHRDVVLVRSSDGGATWSDKVRVNDDLPHYDNAIPAVTVDGSGRVHVSWYDRRDEPECGAKVHTYWTYSADGGRTFVPSRRVSNVASEGGRRYERPGAFNTWTVGDHMALSADGDLVYLLWTEIAPGGSDGEIVGVVLGDPIPGGINLSWGDCGLAGRSVESFACDRNTGPPSVVVASFVPPSGIDEFLGASAELVIGSNTATLPDWWQHGTGYCRAGTGIAVGYTFNDGPYTCVEYGTGQACGDLQLRGGLRGCEPRAAAGAVLGGRGGRRAARCRHRVLRVQGEPAAGQEHGRGGVCGMRGSGVPRTALAADPPAGVGALQSGADPAARSQLRVVAGSGGDVRRGDTGAGVGGVGRGGQRTGCRWCGSWRRRRGRRCRSSGVRAPRSGRCAHARDAMGSDG